MNIGFVSTWYDRGGAYVTKAYLNAVSSGGHRVFVYARGDNGKGKGNPNWDMPYVTFGLNLWDTNINQSHFDRWIRRNQLDIVFFNEQMEFSIVAHIKKDFPKIKTGSYIDYYTETMLPYFQLYDFIICNTHRHMEAMSEHPQKYFVRWGTNIDLFKPVQKKDTDNGMPVFFHSAGMSYRKGTDILVDAFIHGKLYEKSKLVIHTQIEISKQCNYTKEELASKNIEVIEQTVTAPGLYYMGDIYVYPTQLEGVGLTMYEALASGLPVITTNFPPMNEFIDGSNPSIGQVITPERLYARADGYLWPLAKCSESSLIQCMEYYITHSDQLHEYQQSARDFAVKELNWESRYSEINHIFESAVIRTTDDKLCNQVIRKEKRARLHHLLLAFLTNTHFDSILLKFVK
ncbi:MAG TPA: glycosyltransferase family 4 protein [Lachnospiraceae bacterium]|nr:glycosyltransferase family 4 protein [Lachnospiraceae bacterium]